MEWIERESIILNVADRESLMNRQKAGEIRNLTASLVVKTDTNDSVNPPGRYYAMSYQELVEPRIAKLMQN